MYPESLRELIECLRYLPGVGEKSAERYAFSILDMDEEKIHSFASSLEEVKKKVHPCSKCNCLTENEVCEICSNKTRDDTVLCVVEDPKNVFLFERLGTFNGMYHVLSGLISPMDGINPEDIGIDKLITRIKDNHFKEIILALKPSIEGETTALYIKKVLEGLDLTVSKIASGIPMGADMEYIDAMTLERALTDRKNIE